jgi:hypothetical protein
MALTVEENLLHRIKYSGGMRQDEFKPDELDLAYKLVIQKKVKISDKSMTGLSWFLVED